MKQSDCEQLWTHVNRSMTTSGEAGHEQDL